MKTTVKDYSQCASRLEQRGHLPPRKETVDAMIEGVLASGVEAVIHSAVSQAGQPLFPSKVFPHPHPEASHEAFEYLIERLHGIGRPVLSWYPLNHTDSLRKAYPDWQMLPMDAAAERPANDHDNFICINSPYRELLPEFCKEVVRDVGFDGFWFDGSAFAIGNSLAGCGCEFCRRKFQDDTGRPLPAKADWDSHDFKVWVNWRYERLMGFWKLLADAILSVKPRATVAFNNYRRRGQPNGGAWNTGIALRSLGWDVLLSGELDLHALQGDFQMKMHHAMGCKRGQDTWLALCDHWNMWVPDVELTPIRQAAAACAAAGGVLWMGCGFSPRLSPEVCATAQRTTAPLMPYLKDPPVPYAAIWVSQQTQDFHGRERPLDLWNSWHGANELCLHAHVPSAIVFDDQICSPGTLHQYPVLLAGNTACISAEQAAHLRDYVESGGTLIACHEFGSLDEWGIPHDRPLLDDLLGIRARTSGKGTATLELTDPGLIEACGRWVSTAWVPHTLATPTEEVELLSNVVDHGQEAWDRIETQGEPRPRHPGLWRRACGKGQIVYLGTELFRSHIETPSTFQIRLFAALLERLVPPPMRLDAPLQVTLNLAVRPDGTWAVHLHNAPGTIWRYHTHVNTGELVPVHNLRLTMRDRKIRSARTVLGNTPLAVNEDGVSVTLPTLECNEIILLQTTTNVSADHALVFDGPVTNIHEAPAIGNGDLGALVQVFQDEFRLHLGKNDTPPDTLPLPDSVKPGQCVAAAWTVFPGETVAGDEPDGLAPVLRQIMQDNQWSIWHPAVTWIHHWWCAIPALRMQLPDAFEVARRLICKERFPAGHARTTHWIHLTPDAWRVPEENYLGVAARTG